MATKWTDEQQKVIDTTEGNLLVSAAAGSGKTAVLVERIIRIVTDEKNPVDIDRFIIMTFTRAAAAQMRQKIGEALEKRLEENPDSKHLMRQYKLLKNATICTIDSFCVGLVRDYFHELEVDPTFRIADETELGLISADTIKELFEDKYAEGAQDFLRLSEAYGNSKDDKQVEDMVLKLAGKAMSQPWPEEWLEKLKSSYKVTDQENFDNSIVARSIVGYVSLLLEGKCDELKFALEICEMDGGPEFYTDALNELINKIKGITEHSTYSGMNGEFSEISFIRLSTKKCNDESLREKVKTIIDENRKRLKDFAKKFFFTDCDGMLEIISKTESYVNSLVDLTSEYLRRFLNKKKDKNVIDFSDAEHFALQVLLKNENGEMVRTQAALELQTQYSEIIVDEYQDSNLIQECIANAIAGDYKERPYIFTVGDVKQSIYRFRNACPELFIDKQKKYSESTGEGKLIVLDKNFRSREEVLESTNALFMFMMISDIGGINYDNVCSLKCGISDEHIIEPQYKTELIIVSNKKTEEADTTDSAEGGVADASNNAASNEKATDNETTDVEENVVPESIKEIEARVAARRIKELIINQKLPVRAKKNGEDIVRPLEYGDVTVLLRSMKEWASVYAEVFEQEGIPCLTESREGFFKTNEVRLVTYYLSLLDNPRQDIPLTAVLYSVMCGLTTEELATIRIASGATVSFYDAVCMYRKSVGGNIEIINKLNNFFDVFDSIRSQKNDVSVVDLLNMIYDKTYYFSYVSAMRDGIRRKANLELLLGYAASYEKTSYSGLFSFIRYLDQLKSHNLDYGEAGNELVLNAVKIMSIHKSKGLEFPVVILGGMGKEFNTMDMKDSFVVNGDYGIGMKYIDIDKRVKYPSLYESFIKHKMYEEMIGEELRLLYVAMTRAKEKLIMIGDDGKLDTTEFKSINWQEYPKEKIGYGELIKMLCYMQMAYPAAVKNPDLYDIKRFYAGEKAQQPEEIISPVAASDEEQDNELLEKIVKCMESIYPYESDESVPIKLSVSDLKKMSIEDEFGEDIFEETREYELGGKKTVPDFMKEEAEKSGGTNYGTLVHKCMQFIPLNIRTEVEVADFLGGLVKLGKISDSDKGSLSVRKFTGFLESNVAERMLASEKKGGLFRERQFMLGMKACDVRPEYKGIETMIPIQGVIDVVFIEDGQLVILDYKTDKVDKSKGATELVERYRTQLDYYAEAASKLMGLQVKEKLIYSFYLEETIVL